jgi:hypothetical protein
LLERPLHSHRFGRGYQAKDTEKSMFFFEKSTKKPLPHGVRGPASLFLK